MALNYKLWLVLNIWRMAFYFQVRIHYSLSAFAPQSGTVFPARSGMQSDIQTLAAADEILHGWRACFLSYFYCCCTSATSRQMYQHEIEHFLAHYCVVITPLFATVNLLERWKVMELIKGKNNNNARTGFALNRGSCSRSITVSSLNTFRSLSESHACYRGNCFQAHSACRQHLD